MKILFILALFLFLGQLCVMAQSEDKRVEISVAYVVEKVKTEGFNDFDSFAGIPAAQIPTNFQATEAELEKGFKGAFGGSKYLCGVNVSGSYYFNKYFAVVADFSITTKESNRQISNNPIFFEDSTQTRRTRYTFLGGIQWKYRKHRIEPFVRTMAGVTRSRNRISLFISNQSNASLGEESFSLQNDYTAFALSMGGGLDVRVNKRFAVRIIQFDYIPTFPGSRNASLTAPIPNNSGRTDLGLTTLNNSTVNSFRFGAGIVFR